MSRSAPAAARTPSLAAQLRKADSLARAGDRPEAAELYLAVLSRFPANKAARAGLAAVVRVTDPAEAAQLRSDIETITQLLTLGESDAALTCARALVARSPHVPRVHLLLAEMALAMGDYDQGLASAMTAAALDPDDPLAGVLHAIALLKSGALTEALEVAEVVVATHPEHARARQVQGGCLTRLGRCEAALAAFDAALSAAPATAAIHMDRATAGFAIGQTAGALADLDEARRLNPADAEARRMVTVMRRVTPGEPLIDEMRALLEAPKVSPADQVRLHFGLAKAMDDLGETAEAFAHWQQANGIQFELIGFDRVQEDAILDLALRQASAPLTPCPEAQVRARRPIFIVGMPRSGTSLVEQILSCHPDVHGAGEMRLLADAVVAAGGPEIATDPAAAQQVRVAYLHSVARMTPAHPWITDKMPLNFRLVAAILTALPEARIVHVARDPMATCWSNYRHHFVNATQTSGFAYDLPELGRYYQRYADVMAAWDTAAPEALLTLDYDALCADPESGTRRLLDHVGLDWDPACLAPDRNARAVLTTSAPQVRRPIYGGSSDGWRKYEAYLEPLRTALGPLVP